jgi:predicted enzyme related to lactoylglutathione lyase
VADDGEPTVFRVGGVSYLRIPADDPHRAARFYERVFDWRVRHERDEPASPTAAAT